MGKRCVRTMSPKNDESSSRHQNMFFIFSSLRKRKDIEEIASRAGIPVTIHDAADITPRVAETNVKLFLSDSSVLRGFRKREIHVDEEKGHLLAEELEAIGFVMIPYPPIIRKVQDVVKLVDDNGNPVYTRKGSQATDILERITYHHITDRLIFEDRSDTPSASSLEM